MVKTCCVEGCKNENSPSDGVSFHSFPTNKVLKAKWYEALGYEPKSKNPIICSRHFQKEDFKPSTRLPLIYDHAVPVMVKEETPSELKFCRMCLSMDVKMHDMKDFDLIEMYQNITGIPVQLDADCGNIQQCVCWECASRLTAAAELREKAVLSDGLLHNLLKDNHAQITKKDLQSIKEKYINLNSSLVIEKTELYDYQQAVPSKYIKTEIIRNNNKESLNNSNNEDYNDTINNFANNIKDKKIKTDNYDEIEDFGDKIINEVDTDSSGDDKEDVEMFKENKTTGKVPAVINTNNIVLVSKTVKRLTLDENDGLFKVEAWDVAKNGMIKTTADKEKSIVNRVDEEEVQTTSTAKVKIVKLKLKDAGLKTAAAETRKDVKLKRRLRLKTNGQKVKRSRTDDSFASLFTITPLTHEEQIEEILKRQESEKYINAPYKCTVCYRGYTARDRFTAHLLRHNKKSGDFECNICKTRLKTRDALRKHICGQHVEEYSCTKCPFVSRFKGVAQKHQKFHAGTTYQCPHCETEFDKYTTYMGHLRIKHATDYVCELCGFTFVNKKGIDIHKYRKHPLVDETVKLEGPYCEVCDVKFASEEAHDRHLRLSSKHISEHDPLRLRNDSQNMINNARQLREVVRPASTPRVPSTHEPHKPHAPVSCEQCGVQLRNLLAYFQHFRRHHPEKIRTKYSTKAPCMCELCGSIFNCMSLLRDHMWVHTGDKKFKCNRCSKSYTKKSNLEVHLREHEGRRPGYECPKCGKLFTFYSNRQRHMITHTDLKPYKCDTCGKCFNSSTALNGHIQHVHLKKPWPKRIRPQSVILKCEDLSSED